MYIGTLLFTTVTGERHQKCVSADNSRQWAQAVAVASLTENITYIQSYGQKTAEFIGQQTR